MTPQIVIGLLTLGGVALTVAGGIGGSLITGSSHRRAALAAAEAQRETAEAAAAAAVKSSDDTAQDKLIDQLQEELKRYRDDSAERARIVEKRVEHLEQKVEGLEGTNAAYRTFIGVQRDHMAEHGIPLPPWPPNLPR